MQKSVVRSVDIVDKLDYAKSSVSRGVNLLKERGFITFGSSGEISLTESGQKRAEEVFERHKVIQNADVHQICGVSAATANRITNANQELNKSLARAAAMRPKI